LLTGPPMSNAIIAPSSTPSSSALVPCMLLSQEVSAFSTTWTGGAIILDAGTTTVQMVPHLRGVGPLTVVTNALNVAIELRTLPDVRVVLLGGSLNYETFSTHGLLAEQGLEAVVVQKLFLGAQSVEPLAGVTETSPEIARVKRAMVRAARQVILVADSHKWTRTGFIKVAPFSEIQTIVSDAGLSPEARSAVERAGVELILV